jgi:hypothetical protein
MNKYLIIAIISLVFGFLNSLYWYTKGYRGGKLFFIGSIAFFGISMLVAQLFEPKA